MQQVQIKQDVIRSSLRKRGVNVTDEGLQEYLDVNCANISGLVLQPRGRGIDADAPSGPHKARWYDVVSPGFDTDSATDHIISHLNAHGFSAS
jgi:hypothetical protein